MLVSVGPKPEVAGTAQVPLGPTRTNVHGAFPIIAASSRSAHAMSPGTWSSSLKPKVECNVTKPDTSSWKLSDFELKNTLGTGSFGRVRIAHRKGTEEYYAIKCLRKREIIKMKQQQHVAQEKGILMELCHPFIVNMMCSFQDEKKVYFVLEFVMGGEMFTHLRTAGRFP
ncbi:protein kinase A catalytic subunit isoform 2, partial [Leishmania donovani]